MFTNNTNASLSKRQLKKKINWQLVDNFFTLDEFKTLPDRKARKVIKLIARVNRTRLTRTEIKNIVAYLKADMSSKYESVSIQKLWGFVIEEAKLKDKQSFKINFESLVNFFTYRIGKFDLLRI